MEAVTKEEQQTQRDAYDMWGEEFQANWAAAPPTPRAAEQEERADDEDEREESKAEGQNIDNDKTDEQKQKATQTRLKLKSPLKVDPPSSFLNLLKARLAPNLLT